MKLIYINRIVNEFDELSTKIYYDEWLLVGFDKTSICKYCNRCLCIYYKKTRSYNIDHNLYYTCDKFLEHILYDII